MCRYHSKPLIFDTLLRRFHRAYQCPLVQARRLQLISNPGANPCLGFRQHDGFLCLPTHRPGGRQSGQTTASHDQVAMDAACGGPWTPNRSLSLDPVFGHRGITLRGVLKAKTSIESLLWQREKVPSQWPLAAPNLRQRPLRQASLDFAEMRCSAAKMLILRGPDAAKDPF